MLPRITSPDEAKPEILTSPKGAASKLDVGVTKLYQLVKQGKLTPIKFGPRCTRFRLTEIEALIDAHTVTGGAK